LYMYSIKNAAPAAFSLLQQLGRAKQDVLIICKFTIPPPKSQVTTILAKPIVLFQDEELWYLLVLVEDLHILNECISTIEQFGNLASLQWEVGNVLQPYN